MLVGRSAARSYVCAAVRCTLSVLVLVLVLLHGGLVAGPAGHDDVAAERLDGDERAPVAERAPQLLPPGAVVATVVARGLRGVPASSEWKVGSQITAEAVRGDFEPRTTLHGH